MIRAGDQIGPYTLINKLGKGAFGVVWLAERRTQITTTNVAIKIPLDDEITVEKIKSEADLWVRASGHPNVLPIIEANIYDEQIIIASEYAPDGSLADLLKANGKAPTIESAVEIVAGILAGLEHLHSRNIIHRDLKPANILFQGNTPRLADFGISRVLKSTSQSSIVAGTPSYMAPEAFDGKRNEQTDIWSVGVIFYQLLTGHLPFAQEDITSLVGAILTRSPEPLPSNVPSGFQNVIARAIAKDGNIRYKSAAEMRADLRSPQNTVTDPNFQFDKSAYTVQTPQRTYSPTPVYSPSEKKSNTPHFIYAIAGLLGVVIVVLSVIFLFRSSANDNLLTNSNSSSNQILPSTNSKQEREIISQATRIPKLILLDALQKYKYENGWTGGRANSFDDSKVSYYPITSIRVSDNLVTMTYAWKNGVLSGKVSGNDFIGTWTQENGKGKINLRFNDDFSRAQGSWTDSQSGEVGDAFLRRIK